MQKVGFFDSGVGGLTVWNATRQQVDNLSYYYLGDTAHCPYGDRPLNEVRKFALNSVNFLMEKNCEHVVMACNISSSIALEPARKKYEDITIHGLINDDLLQLVKERSSNDRVGVMATAGTVESEFYKDQLEKMNLSVIQQACSPLVPMIEAGHTHGSLVEQTLEPLLEPLRKAQVDTLILGCTHYPFLREPISKMMGSSVEIIDPGEVMARRLSKVLINSNGKKPERSFAVTGEADSVRSALQTHFGQQSHEIITVTPEEEVDL